MHTNSKTIEEASRAPGEFRAGGTDLQERLRTGITTGSLVDLESIPGLDNLDIHDHGASIGALTRISAVGEHEGIRKHYPALALPARTLATPQIRRMATIGGVLCQRTRCWYYRNPDLGCPKKGNASACPAREGNHKFGVCFDFGPCVHPHPSSLACTLLTHDAEVEVTGRGRLPIAELYGNGSDGTRDHLLQEGELITQVHLPAADPGEGAAYFRMMSRKWAEWPLVEVVVRLMLQGETIRDARIGIGGVANIPFRLREVEEFLTGQPVTEEVLASASALSIKHASPLPQTGYKLALVVGSVRQALESAAANQLVP